MKRKILVPLYFFFGGVAGGSYAIGALATLIQGAKLEPVARAAFLIAFPLVLLSAGMLIFDLTRPARFWRLLIAFRETSPVSLGSWALLAFGLISFISFAGLFTDQGDWHILPFLGRFFQRSLLLVLVEGVGLLLGLFVSSYTGVLLSASSRPLWNASPWLGGCFLASAMTTALAFLLLLLSASPEVPPPILHMLIESETTMLILQGVVCTFFIRRLVSRLGPNHPSLASLARGSLAPLMAGFFVLGLLIPLAIFGRSAISASMAFIPLGASSLLAGNLLFRFAIFWSEEG